MLISNPYSLALNILTPGCRIFEKLIVTQLVKKYPAFLRNPKVYHRVHKSPPLYLIQTQSNHFRQIGSYLPKVHVNVIFPQMPRFSLSTSPLHHACHISSPLHPPWFNYSNYSVKNTGHEAHQYSLFSTIHLPSF